MTLPEPWGEPRPLDGRQPSPNQPEGGSGGLPAGASGSSQESVCVAVNVRPLVDTEILEGCENKLYVTPGQPQVGFPPNLYTFDHVFGEGAQPPGALYDTCVAPLVSGLFKGYNATVFAYGQTGSGKTYTMGSAFAPGGQARGVIPCVMDAIFSQIQACSGVDFNVRVGFVEIHKEEIHDLLCGSLRGPRPVVHIREVAGGGVCLAGAIEREVRSQQEMVGVLEQGTLLRATASTGMNKHSSRSHAIFTITLEQRKLMPPQRGDNQPVSARRTTEGEGDSEDEDAEQGCEPDDYLCAKMHLVDLAGSERAKRTQAMGDRLQEGININRGLLALGNVINALSEGKQHVPYRDSKLTRMLQDSLGGNSRTVMIACVSPADINREETTNTLRYANRARNIRNKPMVNRDPVAAQIAHMRQQLAALRSENQSLKGRLGLGDGALLDFASPEVEVLRAAVEDLEARNRQLATENTRLYVEVGSAHDDLREATEKMIVAQAQRDRLLQSLQQRDPAAAAEAAAAVDAIGDRAGNAGDCDSLTGGDVIHGHLQRIAELEREVKRLKQVSRLSGAFVVSNRRLSMEAPGRPTFALSPLSSDGGEDGDRASGDRDDIGELELNDEEFAAQEQAYNMQTAELQQGVSELQRLLEAKQAAMRSMELHPSLRERYDEKMRELQQELQEVQRERMDLLHKLDALQNSSEDNMLKLRAQYEARIKQLDERAKAVAAKEKRVMELDRMKQKAEAACKRLEQDILGIKQQKVNLQRQMERGVKEFADFRRQRDAELVQLKKQGRVNAAQLQKLEALHSKQQAVLRRKTEEAEAARKRLKQLEERQKLTARPATSAATGSAPPSSASAANRPFTAPPAPGGPLRVAQPAPPTATAPSPVVLEAECAPNPDAPLLRDERSRREWVEAELDACCSSIELQQIIEGHRAQRKEVQRKLREVEKAVAALKSPEWWPGHITQSPSQASEEKLLQRKRALLQESETHSREIDTHQAKLMAMRAAEDARGGVPGDAKRWTSVRTPVQARALLKTMFRSASQHKAQAMELQAQVTELADEIELLKLKLDIAEQEKYDAEQRAAEAHALLTAAQQAAEQARPGAIPRNLSTTPARETVAPAPAASGAAAVPPTDEGLLEAEQILQQLDKLADDDEASADAANSEDTQSSASDSEGEEDSWDEEEEEEEEEGDQSDDEARHALWDPTTATPARGAKARRQLGGEPQQRRRRSSTVSGGGSCSVSPEEQPVLDHLNELLQRQGKPPVSKPTVALMKEALKDRTVNGQRWRLGGKKREDLLRDCRVMLGLQPHVDSPAVAGSSAPLSARSAGEGDTSAEAARSRILKHTASSLARTAATLQHPALQQQQRVSTAVPAAQPLTSSPLSGKGTGSLPLPPRSNRTTTSSGERRSDTGSTPVGAEGLTPEVAGPRLRRCDTEGLLRASPDAAGSALLSTGDGGEGRRRNLQLGDLHRQLAELQLGMNVPDRTDSGTQGARSALAPESSPARPVRGSTAVAQQDDTRRSESPLRRLADWITRRSRSSSPRGSLAWPPALGALSGLGPDPGKDGALGADEHPHPALQAHEAGTNQSSQHAAYAAQRVQAEVLEGSAVALPSGSGGPLAQPHTPPRDVFREDDAPQLGDVQQPVAGQRLSAGAGHSLLPHGLAQPALPAQPLRCSNSRPTSASEAGSRAGSPREVELKLGAAPENTSRGPSAAPSPRPSRSALPRSRSAINVSAGSSRHQSPRKQAAWKPL